MKKKILALVLVLALVVSVAVGLAACNDQNDDGSYKVGIILIGDEKEGYSEAHINGIEKAVQNINADGNKVQIIYKRNQGEETGNIQNSANELIAAGCKLIITNSFGHEAAIIPIAQQNPDITFIAMTGNQAAAQNISNLKNAFTKIFEARYVAGVVAGYKLQELVNEDKLTPDNYNGSNIKIGYVGAYPFQEVISGYTAFYLGVKSVVSNVEMTVQFTNSWSNEGAEQTAAAGLISQGCVIISQHADTYGAPTACENAMKEGKTVYCVGYNVDMTVAAPSCALTSATNDWSVYYEYAIRAMLNGETIVTDWAHGYDMNAVGITAINQKLFTNDHSAQIAAVQKGLHDGTIKVFDCSKFTVDGEQVTTWTTASGVEGKECIKTDEATGIKYFDESSYRAAPYFDIAIDGIISMAEEA